MFDFAVFVQGAIAIFVLALGGWLVSLARNSVNIVDALWGLLFVGSGAAYAVAAPTPGPRVTLVILLVSIWALRLSAYIGWRNYGEPEDRRYRAIRERNQPGFAFKSLYLVFGLQGLLAWLISLPLLAAVLSSAPIGWFDWAGLALWTLGLCFESIADWQLARFKARPDSAGKVMDRGLWRYTRHPNYFGEFCIWWGFYLIAVGAGGYWAVISPLLMTILLLRVSGVSLLEKDIGERRPQYAAYRSRTNAFFPGPARNGPEA